MSLSLAELPPEILERIFASITRKDLKNLALTCRKYRVELLSYIMRSIHVTWEQVVAIRDANEKIGLDSEKAQFSPRLFCEMIHILKPEAYHEYHSDVFGRLLSPEIYPRLRCVRIPSSSSTHWLKYNRCSHIRSLSLENFHTVPLARGFCLGHLVNFTSLHSLTVCNYHLGWSETDPDHEESLKVSLSCLKLLNCTWDFPFELSLLNPQDSLRELHIAYSRDNPFHLSERFNTFMKHGLAGHSKSIVNFAVGFSDYAQNMRFLTSEVVSAITKSYTNLGALHLYGWYTTEHNKGEILETAPRNCVIDIDVSLNGQRPVHNPGLDMNISGAQWKIRIIKN